MKTYDLKKGTRVIIRDGRDAELLDSSRRLIRQAKIEAASVGSGAILSYDIVAYRDREGIWQKDLEYSQEEVKQRERRDSKTAAHGHGYSTESPHTPGK